MMVENGSRDPGGDSWGSVGGSSGQKHGESRVVWKFPLSSTEDGVTGFRRGQNDRTHGQRWAEGRNGRYPGVRAVVVGNVATSSLSFREWAK